LSIDIVRSTSILTLPTGLVYEGTSNWLTVMLRLALSQTDLLWC